MNFDETQLLPCGHVGQLAGICQYDECAKQLCPQCIALCEACNTLLCPSHQKQVDGQTRVFCPDHTVDYAVKKLLKTIKRTL